MEFYAVYGCVLNLPFVKLEGVVVGDSQLLLNAETLTLYRVFGVKPVILAYWCPPTPFIAGMRIVSISTSVL